MAALHITDIESAINFWRERQPSPDGISACPEVRALAEVYALMVYHHEHECDEASMPRRAHVGAGGDAVRRGRALAPPVDGALDVGDVDAGQGSEDRRWAYLFV